MYTLKARKSEGAALPKMQPHFHRENVMSEGARNCREKAAACWRAAGWCASMMRNSNLKKLAEAW
jgi:hypothetical protein